MGTGVSSKPSHSIVTQIAEIEGVDPTDLEPPLHAVVDPDALERLIDSSPTDSSGTSLSITFTYRGHRVRVDGSGAVEITTANQLTDASGESSEELHGD
ncbi:HalOD1 output domain-containing protein [Haloterrigena salinisoli]|uniref:HalOD1 output domain-containing protein n=1 Tax=Haloterrigena salinisoli TaxID=3132747 RepID=UPI0030CBBE9D